MLYRVKVFIQTITGSRSLAEGYTSDYSLQPSSHPVVSLKDFKQTSGFRYNLLADGCQIYLYGPDLPHLLCYHISNSI